MPAPFELRVGTGSLRPDLAAETLFLTMPDVRGTYTIPYIQAGSDLEVSAGFGADGIDEVRLSLSRPGAAACHALVTPERPGTCFAGLAPGEYVLDALAVGRGGREVARQAVRRIGIGTVVAALGDSITEGYRGNGFTRPAHLDARLFPPETVSRDGRNFPQYAPTTSIHMPSVNCFQSWMTDLNDLLAGSWGHPVFIANEGWGGYKTDDYLRLMRADAGWQERMRLLRPRLWLIHLGVNDERAHVSPEAVERNLEAMVSELIAHWGAEPRRILLARPCYDYWEGAPAILAAYCRRVEALVLRLGLSPGPDFFAFYSHDHERWYGDDPVHPNPDGMEQMARLWHEAVLNA